jgi:hypothetical protein
MVDLISPECNQGQQSDKTESATRPHKLEVEPPIILARVKPKIHRLSSKSTQFKSQTSQKRKALGKKEFLDLTRMSDLQPFYRKLANIQRR